jgi:Tfp pilus assembly protein FimT
MTLVEVLVVVGILGILGVVTGLFLLKYLPEYNLRSAANTLSQDLRTTQMNALKRLRPWAVKFDKGTNTYQIIDLGDSSSSTDDVVFRTVDLLNYDSSIRFGTLTDTEITFTEEGFADEGITVELTNSAGSISTTEVTRTGAIRVTR